MEKVADLRDESRAEKIGMGLLILTVVLLYIGSACGFFYVDQIENSAHSVLFWDSLLHGRALNAYQDAIDIIGSDKEHLYDWPMCYEPVAYFLLGIINLPAVILYEMGMLKFASFPFYMFVKLQQIIMAFVAACYVYKISKLLSDNDKKTAKLSALMFLSSSGLIYFTLVVGQIEIYAITFALIGIYYWLKGDSIKFVLFFAISVTFKMFTFLIFVPLVLIREKKFVKIVIYCCSGLWFLIIPKILYSQSDAYTASLAESKSRIGSIISANSFINGFTYEHVSTFIVCISVICVFAYLCKSLDYKKWGLYYCFVSFASLFVFVPHYPYWIVIITPFIPLLSATDPKKRNVNIILSILFWCPYLFLCLLYHGWSSNFEMTERMLVPSIFGSADRNLVKYYYLSDFFKDVGLSKYSFIANSTYISALIALVIVNCPKVQQIPKLFNKFDYPMAIIRAMVIVPAMVGLIFIYYKQTDVIVDTTKIDVENLGYNLFTDAVLPKNSNDALRQFLTFDKDYAIKNIRIKLTSAGQQFNAYGSIIVELYNDTAHDTLFVKKIGYNEIINGEYTRIHLPDVIVNHHDIYSLIVKPDRYMPFGGVWIEITKGQQLSGALLYYGNDIVRSLSLKIDGAEYLVN